MSDQPWVAPGADPAGPGTGQPPPPPGWAPPTSGPAAFPPPGQGGPPGTYPPAPAPAYTRMDVRPGIVPLRPLTIGDLFGGVLKAVRGNPGATIGLATLTSLVFLVPTTALGAWVASLGSLGSLDESSSAGASETLPDGFGFALVGQYLPSIGQVFSAILLAGFLASVVAAAVLGRKVTAGRTWRATRGRLPHLVGAVLVAAGASLLLVLVCVGIPVGVIAYGESAGGGNIGVYVLVGLVGLLALVAGSLYLSTVWAFATPSIVVERLGVLGGLRRSSGLVGPPTRQPFWRILGLRLLTSLITGVAASVITFPIALVIILVAAALTLDDPTGDSFLVAQTIAQGVAGLLAGALITPFQAGVDALLYVDARIRREGLDVQLIQAAQGAAPPPWPDGTP